MWRGDTILEETPRQSTKRSHTEGCRCAYSQRPLEAKTYQNGDDLFMGNAGRFRALRVVHGTRP